MRRLLQARFTPAALVGIIALLVAGGGYALASGSNSITLCVKKHGGAVYKAKKCKKHDSKLTFSKTGPTGNAGPAGAAGAAGAKGATGATGAAGARGATGAAGAAGARGATGAAGARGATGTPGPPGATGFVQLSGWAGSVSNTAISPSGTALVFAGPTATVTTTATQRIVASGSAALGTSAGTAVIHTAMCVQPSTGGPVSVLDGVSSDVEVVTASTTRIPFASAMTGVPGAGTWNVGICAIDTSATQAIDSNDRSVGYAFVTN